MVPSAALGAGYGRWSIAEPNHCRFSIADCEKPDSRPPEEIARESGDRAIKNIADCRLPIAMGATSQSLVGPSGYGERGDDVKMSQKSAQLFSEAPRKSTGEQVILEIHDGEVKPATSAGPAKASNP
jgi:hypothetical protein